MNNRQNHKAKAKALPANHQQAQATHWMMRGLVVFIIMAALAIVTAAQSVQATQRANPGGFADLVEKLAPSVVNISTITKVKPRGKNFELPMPFLDEETRKKLEEKFKNRPDVESRSLGSGFFISADGYVVTNNHVVKDATEITIRTVDGEEYTATVKGRAEEVDLALLKVDADVTFPHVKFGSSTDARLGEWVLAIGNPYGLGGTITAGIISGKGRRISNNSYDNYLQTDAPINQGNSGGPLFNMDGDVIGVNTVILSPSGGNVGIGFSIPSNDVKRVVDQLKKYGETRRGWLGVSIRSMDRDLVDALNLPYDHGAVISTVNEGAPSEKAGLKVGDIIVKWDGVKLSKANSLPRLVSATQVGETVDVVILRMDGDSFKELTLPVTTGLYPTKPDMDWRSKVEDEREKAERKATVTIGGMRLENLDEETLRRFRLDEDTDGVLIASVAANSKAFKSGLRAGMVIQRVSFENVESPEEVVEALADLFSDGKKNAALFVVLPGGGKTFVPVEVKDFMPDADE